MPLSPETGLGPDKNPEIVFPSLTGTGKARRNQCLNSEEMILPAGTHRRSGGPRESGGPPRKYYTLTELGRETFEADRAEYLDFARSVRKLLEDENDDKT